MQQSHRKACDVSTSARGRRGGIALAAAVCASSLAACGQGVLTADGEAQAGSFVYVVHRVETTDVLADPEYPEHNITAAGQFVVVKLTATNVSSDKQTFRTAFDTVSDGITEYQVDDAAWRYVGEVMKDVGPGKSIDAAIVFDAPKGVDLDAIVLREGRFADGVAVAL